MPEREPHPCHDCGALPGEVHERYCDVEKCSVCKGQWMQCQCPDHDPQASRWTGYSPGVLECQEVGWFSCLVPGQAWVPCGPYDEGAHEDLNSFAYITQAYPHLTWEQIRERIKAGTLRSPLRKIAGVV